MNLQFNENGKFRIMQIADIQDTNKTSSVTVDFIRQALKIARPDLVVLSGDQIKGYGFNFAYGDKKQKVIDAINNILQPIDESGVPFTFVFGNHDDQAFSLTKEEQTQIYNSHTGCLAFNADDGIDGYCNHNLTVNGKNGTTLNIYLIDSLSMSLDGRCACVTEKQINWYKSVRDRLYEENGRYIPSIVFQHIPVPEIYKLLKEVPKGTKSSARGYKQYDGKYFALDPDRTVIDDRSFIGETPSVPAENNGEFDAFCEKGDVFAAFFGHDHNNSFVGEYNGIKLGYTQGCGFNIYGPGKKRGVRIFDFDENSPSDFTTYTLTVKDIEDFDTGNKLKYGIYTYAPTSVDAVKLILKKTAAATVAATAVGTVIHILKRKKH